MTYRPALARVRRRSVWHLLGVVVALLVTAGLVLVQGAHTHAQICAAGECPPVVAAVLAPLAGESVLGHGSHHGDAVASTVGAEAEGENAVSLAMACAVVAVPALIAFVVRRRFLEPRPLSRLMARAVSVALVPQAWAARPPSLLQLCISRT